MQRSKEKYGQLLRQARESAPGRPSMGALARYLELSVPYLSDIELGRRAPLSTEHTLKAAQFLGVDAKPLLLAAAESRDAIEVRTPNTAKGREAMVALQRRALDLSDEEWSQIETLLSARKGGENK